MELCKQHGQGHNASKLEDQGLDPARQAPELILINLYSMSYFCNHWDILPPRLESLILDGSEIS